MSDKPRSGADMASFTLPAVKGGEVKIGGPGRWQLALVYRGKHCPICAGQLKELNEKLGEFTDAGVEVVAFSTDPQEKAESFSNDLGVDFPIGYGFSIDKARELGLYISEPRNDQETDRPFSEPGLFVTNPDGKIQLVDISNSPFTRPGLDWVLKGINIIKEKNYPIRGTA
ncbi:MAG: peroxiredoxin-like family protein [Kiloniellales bacterium]|nr:peroxiredoxin-like family protein [Kiloniellales bacterium]